MALYEVDRFEPPPDPDLVCCICQCVLHNPLESPCQHVFCKVCIETWLTNRKNCPNCRKSLRISKLKPVLPIVRNMINRLIIRCDNYSHGCIEGIKLEYYDVHVKQCGYGPLKCMNTCCDITVLRKDMLDHEKECKFRLILCKKGCGFPVSAELEQKHNCVAALKLYIENMEETFNTRLKSLSEEMKKLQKQNETILSKLKEVNTNAARESGNEISSDSTGATTPVPDIPGSDGNNPWSTPNYMGEYHWVDTASDGSFISDRETPVNHEDQDSRWSWLNSEDEGQSDVGDLSQSAVDALLASDVDNTAASPQTDGNDHRDTFDVSSSPGEPHNDSADNQSLSANASQESRTSGTEHSQHTPRSSNLNNADSTSNVEASASHRYQDGMSTGSPTGSSDDDSSAPTQNDVSSAISTTDSPQISDMSQPSSPVYLQDVINAAVDMDSQTDDTWTPTSRSRASSEHGSRSDDDSERSENSPINEGRRRRRDESSHRHTHRSRRRSTEYYSSDEQQQSNHSRAKRSRRR